MIDGFGNEYFIGVYKKLLETDKRPKLKKYFRYILGKLYLAEGKNGEAINYFQEALNDPDMDSEYEKMLYARCCEGMAEASSSPTDKNYWTQQMYDAFPQLVPHTSLKMRFRLEGDVSGSGSKFWMMWAWICAMAGIIASIVLYYLKRSGNIRKMHPVIVYLPFVGMTIICIVFSITAYGIKKSNPRGAIIDALENCNIETTNDIDVPVVEFSSEQTADAIEINYVVRKAASSEEITSGILHVPLDKIDDGGKLFAYRLFGIKKKEIGEEPPAEVIPTEKKDDKKP
jgi:tetratricopeptide (TPR) repeat protein